MIIFVGEFDPTTPPEYGRRAVATLPNAHLLVLPRTGPRERLERRTVSIRKSFLDDPRGPPGMSCVAELPPLIV